MCELEEQTLRVGLQKPDTVIKQHGLDVERRQNTFLILQRGVVDVVLIGWQDDAHVTQVDVDGSQVGPAQRSALNMWHASETRRWYATIGLTDRDAHSRVRWRLWGSCVASPTLSSGTPEIPRTRWASARDSGSYWLSEASPGYADQSEPTSRPQIYKPPRDRSKRSSPPRCESEREQHTDVMF